MASPPEPDENGVVATAEEGVVLLDGPFGVALSMTPQAARSSAQSLNDAAESARGQRKRS